MGWRPLATSCWIGASGKQFNKATWPSLFGLDASRARCDELLSRALARLDVFGADAAALEWLARFIVERGR